MRAEVPPECPEPAWLFRALLAALIVICGLTGCGASDDGANLLVVDNARIRALIPGQDKTAGYFELANRSDQTVRLVGAQSAAARSIEMHTTTLENGIMRMRRLTDVPIEPGTTLRFQPGGHHLMLFGVRSLGDGTEVQLLFEDGRSLSVPFRQIDVGAE